MYRSLIRPVLFLFDPERVHRFTFGLIGWLAQVPGVKGLWRRMYVTEDDRLKRTCFGITFPNPVGLAAGFDKDAERIDELACFGFGFVEIGTVTPRGQPGNGKPRLFRLLEDGAIINRMGFNNAGTEAVMRRLRNRSSDVIVGGNIGKNKITPNEEAFRDYEAAFNALFDYVDYFVVNVSSPNTPDLRALQDKAPLSDLLTKLQGLNGKKGARKPLLLKIAPDLNESQLTDIVDIARALNLDGIIATNTTVSRAGLTTRHDRVEAIGAGGISGRPLRQRSTDIIRFLRRQLGPDFPIIGVGGIMSARDALEKIEAGASLVQVYTGFVYEGPGLVKAINKALLRAV